MLRLKKDKTPDTDVSPATTVTPEPAPMPVVVDSEPPRKAGIKPAWLAVSLGSLALLGGAAYFLTRPAPEPEVAAPVITRAPKRIGGNSAGVPGGNGTGVTTATSTTVTTPGIATAPGGATMPSNSITTTTTVTNKAAPAGAPSMPRGAASSSARRNVGTSATSVPPPPMPVVSAANVRPGPGAPPTLAPPAMNARPMMTPLTPDVAAQLKALWLEGAAAKHRGDLNGAREAWSKALRLRPGHPGFAEAIRRLPARR